MFRIPVLYGPVVCCALVAAPGAIGQAAASDEVPEGLTATGWSGIRAAYEAGRHAAHPVKGGYRARNPGQQWHTRFDGRGFTTKPDAGAWTWGLELLRYGFAGRERAVVRPAGVSAEGQRVAYDWDETLTEWYVNDTRGLEHGYTVHRRPAGHLLGEEKGPLTFTLALRGELSPKVQGDGRGVRFVNGDGAAVLTYTGLTVLDADGRSLPARLESVPEGLLLTVDERGAHYPLTIDPIVQQAYLKASNTDADDRFGSSVAVSGDTVVVGAPREDSGATGVNGDQSDNGTTGSGAAYVFVRSGTGWSQQAYLKASNTDTHFIFLLGDEFGSSVAVSGDTVVVGAHWESSNATGVDGDQGNNFAQGSGAAYVFDITPGAWTYEGNVLAGTYGNPVLGGAGPLVADTPVTLTLANALVSADATLVVGLSNQSLPFKGGMLVPSLDLVVPKLRVGTDGSLAVSGRWPAGLPSGFMTYYQVWIADPAGPEGFAASNAISSTTP